MKNVYLLWEIKTDEYDREYELLEAIYATRALAKKAKREYDKDNEDKREIRYSITEQEVSRK